MFSKERLIAVVLLAAGITLIVHGITGTTVTVPGTTVDLTKNTEGNEE